MNKNKRKTHSEYVFELFTRKIIRIQTRNRTLLLLSTLFVRIRLLGKTDRRIVVIIARTRLSRNYRKYWNQSRYHRNWWCDKYVRRFRCSVLFGTTQKIKRVFVRKFLIRRERYNLFNRCCTCVHATCRYSLQVIIRVTCYYYCWKVDVGAESRAVMPPVLLQQLHIMIILLFFYWNILFYAPAHQFCRPAAIAPKQPWNRWRSATRFDLKRKRDALLSFIIRTHDSLVRAKLFAYSE